MGFDVKNKLPSIEVIRLVYNLLCNKVSSHALNVSNPHGVTKEQLGLNNIDNTSDIEKPVSNLQAEAILNAAEKVISDVDKELERIENTKVATEKLANEAVTSDKIANSAVTRDKISEGATYRAYSFFLSVSGWENNYQTVEVDGVTEHNTVIVSPDPSSYNDYGYSEVVCVRQGFGTLSFTCAFEPSKDLLINAVIPV